MGLPVLSLLGLWGILKFGLTSLFPLGLMGHFIFGLTSFSNMGLPVFSNLGLGVFFQLGLTGYFPSWVYGSLHSFSSTLTFPPKPWAYGSFSIMGLWVTSFILFHSYFPSQAYSLPIMNVSPLLARQAMTRQRQYSTMEVPRGSTGGADLHANDSQPSSVCIPPVYTPTLPFKLYYHLYYLYVVWKM